MLDGNLSCHMIYQDNDCIAILDKYPIDNGHSLIITKKPYEKITDMDVDEVAKLFSKIPKEFKKYYAFGGGTALSLCYFHHRLSFDVDIFIYPNSAKKTSSIIFNLEEDEFALA